MSLRVENDIDNHIAESLELNLANAIRKHPIIYDRSHFSNAATNAIRLKVTWERISDDVNLEVESCKTLWTCIKQKFIKYRKRINSGEQVTKEWALYDTLYWLDDHIKRRRTRNEMVKLRQPDIDTFKIKRSNSADISAVIALPLANEFELEFAEWNEENQKDRRPTTTKRNRDFPVTVSKPAITKRRLKIELPNVSDKQQRGSEIMTTTYSADADSAEMLTDLESQTTETMDSMLKSQKSDEDTVEILEIVDKPVLPPETEGITSKLAKETKISSLLPPQLPNFDKLETVIGNCVRLAERCIADNTNLDSSEMFGKYIASLVRELPAEKRTQVQFDILQFTSNIVAKEKKRNLTGEI